MYRTELDVRTEAKIITAQSFCWFLYTVLEFLPASTYFTINYILYYYKCFVMHHNFYYAFQVLFKNQLHLQMFGLLC